MHHKALKHLAQRLLNTSRTLIITGAGISAESGISTFRGAGGYWNRYKAEELASPQGFARDPELVWQWYNDRREALRIAKPNAAHKALPRLARALKSTTLVTQNVDGLHGEDLSNFKDYVEIHGNICRVKCTRSGKAWLHQKPLTTLPPRCACGQLLRPDVLWFGETYAQNAMHRALTAARQADNVLVIGTSGLVWIVAGLLEQAMPEAYTAEFNLETTALSDVVDISFLDKATQTLPALVEHLHTLKNC